jgi:hypothetical protein
MPPTMKSFLVKEKQLQDFKTALERGGVEFRNLDQSKPAIDIKR